MQSKIIPQKYVKEQLQSYNNKSELSQEIKTEALKDIAISIAHEIKNPLSLVSANIDLLELKDNKLSTNFENYNIIRRELSRINDMVMEFINFTSGAKREFSIITINEVLSELIEEYTISLGDNINFNVINFEKSVVNGSKNDLRMLFSNIFKNAIEAMDYCGEISINLSNLDNQIYITIADSGEGFSNNEILMPFYSTKENGNGLGLSICNQIAELHKGTFELFRNENAGATARVIFPSRNNL